ncbi:S24 family peptidase [Staphylococcus aureus]|uniref:S24 family peptidase n=1 Tax=Staphylococcus aureus TaxID=1280 RepID=UPI000DFACD88|nr:S24 family peptidase [Staphylococcus aureus]SUK09181.1 putative phage PVL repressor protein [Staphylococcus aureus]SUK14467.1 putative phage PVL repressor protein [Staphylococcus aureus]
MKEKVSDRLKHIMKIRNLKQVDIINKSKPYQKQLGITLSKSTLSQYINDVQSPDQDRIYLLSKTLNVGEAWLMGYDVDSYRVPDEERQIETTLSQVTSATSQLQPPRQQVVLECAEEQLEEQRKEEEANKSEEKTSIGKIVSMDEYKERKTVELSGGWAVGAGIGEHLYDGDMEEVKTFYKDEVPSNADFWVLVNGDSMEPFMRKGTHAFIKKTQHYVDGMIALICLNGEAMIKKLVRNGDTLELISLNPSYETRIATVDDDFRLVGKIVQ